MKTLQVSDETYERIKEQLKSEEKVNFDSYNDFIGKSFFFRTVTYHIIGKVIKIVGTMLQLEQASWVADSGRFMNAIKEGTLNEVEPVGDWFVNIGAIVDFGIWDHELPKKQK
jgi:hypothetical protein